MHTIDQHIKDLLSEHDCVIIPGFGAFIADYKPAVINDGKSSTPGKYLLFNSKLSRNDGLLINALVEKDGIEYNAAKLQLAEYIEGLGAKLQNGESYLLEGIGLLQLDEAGFVQFIEQEDNSCHLEAYGLPPIQLDKIEASEKDQEASPLKPRHSLNNVTKYAAAIAAIIVLVILIRPGSKPTDTDFAQLSPSNIDSPKIASTSPVNSSNDSLTQIKEEDTTIEEQKIEPRVPQKQYHVIIASLASESKAKDYMLSCEIRYDFDEIQILEGSGRFRISAAWYDNSDDAINQVKSLRQDHSALKDAWVLPITR